MGFGSLEIGRRGLTAQRIGLDVTSNNIANVNTPGYTRQRAVFAETRPAETQAGQIGTGVNVARIDRVRQEFFDREIRINISNFNKARTDTQVVDRIEALLAETSDFSLDQTIKSFFAAFDDLSLRPESIDKRRGALNAADGLVKHFNAIGQNISDVRQDTRLRAGNVVSEVNRLVTEIADLNRRVTSSSSGSGSAAALEDQRALRIDELSELISVQVTFDTDNNAQVTSSGNTLITGTSAADLELRESINSVSGERTLEMVQVNEDGEAIITYDPDSGELGSLLFHYNVTLDSFDSSGGYSVAAEIDTLADSIVDQVNTIANTGFGLDDAGPAAPGRNIFTPATATNPIQALNLSLSTDILDQPRNVPTSSRPNEPGNNEVSRQIADLIGDQNFVGGSTVNEYYASIVSEVGTLGSDARNSAESSELIGNTLFAQREAVNGVNLDEEAVNLIKFQRAFEASARIINTTSELLSIVVNLGR